MLISRILVFFCFLPNIQNSLVQGLLASKKKFQKYLENWRQEEMQFIFFEWRFQKYPICIPGMKLLFAICKFCFCKTSFGMVFNSNICLFLLIRNECMKYYKKFILYSRKLRIHASDYFIAVGKQAEGHKHVFTQSRQN